MNLNIEVWPLFLDSTYAVVEGRKVDLTTYVVSLPCLNLENRLPIISYL